MSTKTEHPIAPGWAMVRDDEGNVQSMSVEPLDKETPQGGLIEDLCWLGGAALGCVLLSMALLMVKGLPVRQIAELLWRAQ